MIGRCGHRHKASSSEILVGLGVDNGPSSIVEQRRDLGQCGGDGSARATLDFGRGKSDLPAKF
jgi:hypothetical protein